MPRDKSSFLNEPERRVGLLSDPYHGSVLPLNYSGGSYNLAYLKYEINKSDARPDSGRGA